MVFRWHVGDVLAKVRTVRGLKARDVAAKVGVHRNTIRRLEEGDPKVRRETYLKVAKLLKVSMAEVEQEAARIAAGTLRDSVESDDAWLLQLKTAWPNVPESVKASVVRFVAVAPHAQLPPVGEPSPAESVGDAPTKPKTLSSTPPPKRRGRSGYARQPP